MTDQLTVARSLGALGVSSGRWSTVTRRGHLLLALPEGREVAARTLRLYQPQRGLARAVAWIVRRLVAAGLHRRVLPTLALEPVGSPLLAEKIDGEVGFLLGSSEHTVRRVVATYQLRGRWEVAKIAFGPEGIGMLERESAVLDSLGSLESRFSGAPGWIGLHQSEELAVMRMPSIEGRPLEAGETAEAMALLDEWIYEQEGMPLPEFPEWPAIQSALKGRRGGDQAIKALAEFRIRPVLRHGDFARWNLLKAGDGRVVAIDWEWGEKTGMGGLDLVHFIGQELRLVRKLPATEAVAELLRELGEPTHSEHLGRVGWGAEYLLPILACFAFKQGAGHQDNEAILAAALDAFLKAADSTSGGDIK